MPSEATEPTLARQPTPAEDAPAERTHRRGAGLVLVAQPGDKMRMLYSKIYRDLRPPAYAEVVAANRVPFRPGAVVVYPAPPGGWTAH